MPKNAPNPSKMIDQFYYTLSETKKCREKKISEFFSRYLKIAGHLPLNIVPSFLTKKIILFSKTYILHLYCI